MIPENSRDSNESKWHEHTESKACKGWLRSPSQSRNVARLYKKVGAVQRACSEEGTLEMNSGRERVAVLHEVLRGLTSMSMHSHHACCKGLRSNRYVPVGTCTQRVGTEGRPRHLPQDGLGNETFRMTWQKWVNIPPKRGGASNGTRASRCVCQLKRTPTQTSLVQGILQS